MSDIYTDGTYLQNNPTWHQEDSRWKAEQITRMLLRNRLEAGSVCEVGCGGGEILNQLHSLLGQEVQLQGYEISAEAYGICKAKEKERLRFTLMDHKSIPDNSCDLLLCIDVFEHVEDYFGFLREIKKKAGHKMFHIPLDINVLGVMRNLLMTNRKLVGHIHYFTRDTALATLRDCGYEIVDFTYTASSLALPTGTLRNRLARLPRQLLYKLSPDLASTLMGGWSLLVLTK